MFCIVYLFSFQDLFIGYGESAPSAISSASRKTKEDSPAPVAPMPKDKVKETLMSVLSDLGLAKPKPKVSLF